MFFILKRHCAPALNSWTLARQAIFATRAMWSWNPGNSHWAKTGWRMGDWLVHTSHGNPETWRPCINHEVRDWWPFPRTGYIQRLTMAWGFWTKNQSTMSLCKPSPRSDQWWTGATWGKSDDHLASWFWRRLLFFYFGSERWLWLVYVVVTFRSLRK